MRIDRVVDMEQLRAGIEARLINVRESGDGQRIYNYSDLAVYTAGAWDNPAVRQCRGLIVNADDEVIARPWAKFFNHGQVEAGDLDMSAPVQVTDKVDGSLGILHRATGGRWRIATRGSFTSDQAIHATDVLNERYGLVAPDPQVTALFEIVYPENRIVCDYGQTDDLILLGGVEIETGRYLGPSTVALRIGWVGPVADSFDYPTLADALAAPDRAGAEGLCVRYLDQPKIVKIKQADYVALHRIVTGLSERTVWEAICEGKRIGDLLAGLPDELHEWVRDVWARIYTDASIVLHESIQVHDKIKHLTERRDYAKEAAAHPEVRPYLFLILDNKSAMPSILKSLKPVGNQRAKSYSEDVA